MRDVGAWSAVFYQTLDGSRASLRVSFNGPHSHASFDFDSATLPVGEDIEGALGFDVFITDDTQSPSCQGKYRIDLLEFEGAGPVPGMNVPIARARVAWRFECNPVTNLKIARGCLDYDRTRPNPSGYVSIQRDL